MSRLENIPETNHDLMNFAGTRIVLTDEIGYTHSKLQAIQTLYTYNNCKICSLNKDASYRASFCWNPMNDEWKKRRQEMRKKTEKDFPKGMFELRNLLLSFGGEDVCFIGIEEDLNDILAYGQFWFGKNAKMMKGYMSKCHANSAALWQNNKEKTRICTGYALSDDGMWRQHSWVLQFKERSNQIIETTTKRIGYFGFCMNTERCERFANENYY